MLPVPARLGAFYFAYFAYVGAYVPYFAIYLAAQGFDAREIALVLGMPQLARIVAPGFWGWLADRWAPRHPSASRTIVVFSCAVIALAFAALGWVQDFGAVLALIVAMSLLSCGAMPLVEAIALASLRGGAGGYGPVRLWGSIGFIVAVLGCGAWLDARTAADALRPIALLAFGTLVASLLLPQGPALPSGQAGGRLVAALLRRGVPALFGACFCMAVAHGALYAFYSIHLDRAGYGKTLIGLMWTLGVVAEVLVFLYLPGLLRRFTLHAILGASLALAAVRFGAIGWGVESVALLAAAQILHAGTFGAFHAASVAAVQKLFPGSLHARGQALYSSLSYGLGGLAGTLLAGWTWDALGPALTFSISAVFGLAGLGLVMWKVRL
jgi:PPP family 3-phenylpropionic acid transporter